jgi:hypothetical protein
VSESSQVTKPAIDAINARPRAKAIKLHGSIYMESGTPDVHAVVAGVAYWLEAKLPGEKPDPIQRKRMREWAAAGAVVGVIESKAEALAIIDGDHEMRRKCAARAGIDLDAPVSMAPNETARGALAGSTRA